MNITNFNVLLCNRIGSGEYVVIWCKFQREAQELSHGWHGVGYSDFYMEIDVIDFPLLEYINRASPWIQVKSWIRIWDSLPTSLIRLKIFSIHEPKN